MYIVSMPQCMYVCTYAMPCHDTPCRATIYCVYIVLFIQSVDYNITGYCCETNLKFNKKPGVLPLW